MIELSKKFITVKISYYSGNKEGCENSAFNYREFFGKKKDIAPIKKGNTTYNIHLIYLDKALEYNNKVIKNYINGSYAVILESKNDVLEELAKNLNIKTCLLNSDEKLESTINGLIDEFDDK
ncbi:MAG: hypothetical protein WC393_00975 [Candidatus Nanoarchaeia archaeon]|jgi:hypothetical protein